MVRPQATEGWAGAPASPQKEAGVPRRSPLSGLSRGPAPGTGVLSLPTLCPGQAPAQPLPALSLGRLAPVLHIPAALGYVAETPCFRDPRRYPWLQGLCVGSGMWGEGLGRGAGEDIPHQESQRQGRALPQEPPLCPSTPPCPPGQPAAFPSPPVALRCSELHGSPHPGQPGRSTNGESLTNAKKTVGAPSASPGHPLFPQDRPPAVSAWSANTGPSAGRAPLPWPVSEIAH